MNYEEKNIPDFNKSQSRQSHLVKIKNEFVSFLLTEIKTHFNNIDETRHELLHSALTHEQLNVVEQIKTECEHSYILLEEIANFLDLDTAKNNLTEFQFDLKDYFEKRRNANLAKDLAGQFPLNILFWENDLFNKKLAGSLFYYLGYSVDFDLQLNEGLTKEYDLVFVDLSKNKNVLSEQSDTIYAYFADKKRPYIVAICPDNINSTHQSAFEHSVDANLISPLKVKSIVEIIETAYQKSRTEALKPLYKRIDKDYQGKFIERDKISFIQEIQTEEDIVFFIELIDVFIVETPKIFKIIKEAIINKDYEKIHFGGHKLRGSSLTMGIDLYIIIGAQLEKEADSKNITEAKNLLEQLEHSFVKIVEELEDIKVYYKMKYLNEDN